MKTRGGQIAVCLALVLVAVCILALMNVSAYLAVTAKNRAMNAGDAAALAVAKHQGELINRIGALNVEHLKAAVADEAEKCEETVQEQLELSLLGPVDGILVGNDAAKANGAEQSDRMRDILLRHALDVRQFYVGNPDLYPEAWEGAWEAYARKIETAVFPGIWAGPDNIDFIDAASGHMLLCKCFYRAVAGRNWCWFFFNAPGLLDSYSSFRDWSPLPSSDDETRRRRCVNSEIYSLHLRVVVGSAVTLLGTNLVMQLTGATAKELSKSELVRDPGQKWIFYDTYEWRKWTEIDPVGPAQFPVVGSVKREYDVKGCAAACRVERKFSDIVNGIGRETSWSGAAKPFGTVENESGEVDVVTAVKGGFVVPAFTDTRLVPLDAVGGIDLSTADAGWMDHVKLHLPVYLEKGPDHLSPCWYCQQLAEWELPSFRQAGRFWLKYHSGECSRCDSCGDGGRGGTPHGH